MATNLRPLPFPFDKEKRKRLLLFAGGATGRVTLQTIVRDPLLRELVDVELWPDYHTTVNPEDRFYGAWETAKGIEREQYEIYRLCQKLKAAGLRSDHVRWFKRTESPTFTRQRCIDFMKARKERGKAFDAIIAATFGRLIPNEALELVGAKIADGRVVQPGKAWVLHPGFVRRSEELALERLPDISIGKGVIKRLVTRPGFPGRAFRVFVIEMIEQFDHGRVVIEGARRFLPRWYGDVASAKRWAVNQRIREAVTAISGAYPSLLQENLIPLLYSSEECRERKFPLSLCLQLGFEITDVIRAGVTIDLPDDVLERFASARKSPGVESERTRSVG